MRVRREGAAVGMVGGQHDAPRVLDPQQDLEADRPLHRAHQVALPVGVRHDAAAALDLDVEVEPLAPGGPVQPVLRRRVGADGGRGTEDHLTGVARESGVRVDPGGDLRRPAPEARRRPSAVGVVLKVRHVRRQAGERLEGREGHGRVARHPQAVHVQVQGVRQAEIAHRAGQRLDDAARGEAGRRPRGVEDRLERRGGRGGAGGIGGLRPAPIVEAALPGLDAARARGLDAEGARGLEDPGDILPQGVGASLGQEAKGDLVVAEQDQERLVDDRDGVEVGVRGPRPERRDRGLDDRGVSHAGVEAPGLGQRREGAPAVLRAEEARRRDRRPRDVRVQVDAARHDHQVPGLQDRRRGGKGVHDPAVPQADVAHLGATVARVDHEPASYPKQPPTPVPRPPPARGPRGPPAPRAAGSEAWRAAAPARRRPASLPPPRTARAARSG